MSRRNVFKVMAAIVIFGSLISCRNPNGNKEQDSIVLILNSLKSNLADGNYEMADQLMTSDWRSKRSLKTSQGSASSLSDILEKFGQNDVVTISPNGTVATIRTETKNTTGYVLHMKKEIDGWKVSGEFGTWGPAF